MEVQRQKNATENIGIAMRIYDNVTVLRLTLVFLFESKTPNKLQI